MQAINWPSVVGMRHCEFHIFGQQLLCMYLSLYCTLAGHLKDSTYGCNDRCKNARNSGNISRYSPSLRVYPEHLMFLDNS